jgi:hypothetical protein
MRREQAQKGPRPLVMDTEPETAPGKLPGLDLMLRSDASGVARETAQRILHDLRAAKVRA